MKRLIAAAVLMAASICLGQAPSQTVKVAEEKNGSTLTLGTINQLDFTYPPWLVISAIPCVGPLCTIGIASAPVTHNFILAGPLSGAPGAITARAWSSFDWTGAAPLGGQIAGVDSSGATKWYNRQDITVGRTSTVCTDDLWYVTVTLIGNCGLEGFVTGAAAAITIVDPSTTGRPGQWLCNAGTAATGACALTHPTMSKTVTFGSGTWKYAASFKVNQLSTATETFTVYGGFSQARAAPAGGTDGIFVSYTDAATGAHWFGIVRAGSSPTTCDMGITLDTTAFHTYGIVVNDGATQVDFYYDDALKCSIVSGIPTGTQRSDIMPMSILKSATAGASPTITMDWYSYSADLTR